MSVQYIPAPPVTDEDASVYAYRELQDLTRALTEAQEIMPLQVVNVAPTKPRAGMIAHADGTNWNPGAGAGPYAYIGSTWTPLFTGGAGGVSDGDKGDITVSSGGTVWDLDLTLDQINIATASVNFNGQQATSFRIENRTSDPGTPTTGQIWLRTDL